MLECLVALDRKEAKEDSTGTMSKGFTSQLEEARDGLTGHQSE